ncbi:MAG: GntR family transcriptional regulator, partial [Gaiellaceae bacterium]
MQGVNAATLAGLLAGWRNGRPAERQLAATVRALILDGRLPLEARVPAERELAAALGISRSTVTAAYNMLRSDGYLHSRQGAGSWVTMPGGHRAASDTIFPASGLDLRIAALPAPPELDALVAEALRALPRWLDHHGYDPRGWPPLRAASARRFTARGLPTTSEQILVVNGALQALDL